MNNSSSYNEYKKNINTIDTLCKLFSNWLGHCKLNHMIILEKTKSFVSVYHRTLYRSFRLEARVPTRMREVEGLLYIWKQSPGWWFCKTGDGLTFRSQAARWACLLNLDNFNLVNS